MHRYQTITAVAAMLLVGSAGCAFSDGEPWGEARFEVSARFDPSERLDDDGLVRTARNYLVDVETIGVVLDAATLELALGEGNAAVSFDPANPPEGFTLCHGGHCHADGGSLVAYEDIEAMLAGGSAGDERLATVQAFPKDVVIVDIDGERIPNGECSNSCFLDPGSLATLSLVIGEVVVEARVFDQLDRLPDAGVPVRLRVDVNVALERSLEGEVGEDEPIVVHLTVGLDVPPHIFDGIDWADILPTDATADRIDVSDASGVATAMAADLEEHGAIEVDVRRR